LVKGCPRYGFPKKWRGSKPSKKSLPNSPHPYLQAIELLSTYISMLAGSVSVLIVTSPKPTSSF
jgi:hypothetical protein